MTISCEPEGLSEEGGAPRSAQTSEVKMSILQRHLPPNPTACPLTGDQGAPSERAQEGCLQEAADRPESKPASHPWPSLLYNGLPSECGQISKPRKRGAVASIYLFIAYKASQCGGQGPLHEILCIWKQNSHSNFTAAGTWLPSCPGLLINQTRPQEGAGPSSLLSAWGRGRRGQCWMLWVPGSDLLGFKSFLAM